MPGFASLKLDAGGAAADTGWLGFEFTGPVVPLELLAVTSTTTAWPFSVCVSVYDCLFAPEIPLQFAPAESQRNHWYENDVGLFPQHALPAETVLPPTSVPSISGGQPVVGGAAALAPDAVDTAPAATTTNAAAMSSDQYESLLATVGPSLPLCLALTGRAGASRPPSASE